MRINFCTLFDSGYLARGLSLIDSLHATDTNFRIYILAMDEIAYVSLNKLNLENTVVIALKEFESPELLAIKSSRSRGEYCWTCTPHLIRYCLEKYNLDHCTYLDADIFFFNSPRLLLNENPATSVLITDHYYTKEYDQTKTSGKYCVQFMYFKNDRLGLEALRWWQDQCTEWCYARHEDGKFGDQKYLDDWTTRFENVHVLQNRAGCLAPWNIQQFTPNQQTKMVIEKTSQRSLEIGLYHFHELKVYDDGFCDLGHYKIKKDVVNAIYRPYLKHLISNRAKVKDIGLESRDFLRAPAKDTTYYLRLFKRWLKGNLNIYKISALTEKS